MSCVISIGDRFLQSWNAHGWDMVVNRSEAITFDNLSFALKAAVAATENLHFQQFAKVLEGDKHAAIIQGRAYHG